MCDVVWWGGGLVKVCIFHNQKMHVYLIVDVSPKESAFLDCLPKFYAVSSINIKNDVSTKLKPHLYLHLQACRYFLDWRCSSSFLIEGCCSWIGHNTNNYWTRKAMNKCIVRTNANVPKCHLQYLEVKRFLMSLVSMVVIVVVHVVTYAVVSGGITKKQHWLLAMRLFDRRTSWVSFATKYYSLMKIVHEYFIRKKPFIKAPWQTFHLKSA